VPIAPTLRWRCHERYCLVWGGEIFKKKNLKPPKKKKKKNAPPIQAYPEQKKSFQLALEANDSLLYFEADVGVFPHGENYLEN